MKTKNKVIVVGGSSLAIIVSFGRFYLDWRPILLLTIGAIFFVALIVSWLETKEEGDKITWICLLVMCTGTVVMVVGYKIDSFHFVLCGAAEAIFFSVVFLFHLHTLVHKAKKLKVSDDAGQCLPAGGRD